MNNFVVPQFIDVEAKIFGPITARQFVISLFGGFFIVLAYKFSDTGLFIIESLVIAGIVFLFGFFKVNGRPFYLFVINVIETLQRPSIRVWKVTTTSQVKQLVQKGEIGSMSELQKKKNEPPTKSRLQQISLVVDTGGVYKTDQ